MVRRTASNSVLTDKMKRRIAKVKDKDIQLNFGGSLPAGIENGVAKLVDIKIATYEKGDNKGKPYFMIRGVVVSPKSYDGIPVEGRQESFVMEPLHSTPSRARKTEDEHIDYMIGVLKNLGVDSDNLEPEEIDDGTLFNSMIEEELYFRFRTWKGQPTEQFPNARTNVSFAGGALDYVNGEVEDDVEDATEESEEEDEEEVEDEEGEEEEESEEEESEEEEEEAVVPEKGEVWYYKPPKSRRDVECEITAVFENKETCNLKSLVDGKLFKGIAWTELAAESST